MYKSVTIHHGIIAHTQREVHGCGTCGHGDGLHTIVDVVVSVIGQLDGDFIIGDFTAGDGAIDSLRSASLAHGFGCECHLDGWHVIIMEHEKDLTGSVVLGCSTQSDGEIIGRILVLDNGNIDSSRCGSFLKDHSLWQFEAFLLLDVQIDSELSGIVALWHAHRQLYAFPFAVV